MKLRKVFPIIFNVVDVDESKKTKTTGPFASAFLGDK